MLSGAATSDCPQIEKKLTFSNRPGLPRKSSVPYVVQTPVEVEHVWPLRSTIRCRQQILKAFPAIVRFFRSPITAPGRMLHECNISHNFGYEWLVPVMVFFTSDRYRERIGQ